MKRKSLICLITILVSIFYLTGLSFTAEEKKGEIKVTSRIVTIHPSEGLRPPMVTADLGTTIVWLNRDRSPVELLFLDPKITLACGAPVNFFIGKNGAFESAKIPFGGTASLCFTKIGKFDYVVKSSRTFYDKTLQRDHRGSINIR